MKNKKQTLNDIPFKSFKSFMLASPVALLRLTVLKLEWSTSTAGPEPAQSSRDDPHSLPQKGIWLQRKTCFKILCAAVSTF